MLLSSNIVYNKMEYGKVYSIRNVVELFIGTEYVNCTNNDYMRISRILRSLKKQLLVQKTHPKDILESHTKILYEKIKR